MKVTFKDGHKEPSPLIGNENVRFAFLFMHPRLEKPGKQLLRVIDWADRVEIPCALLLEYFTREKHKKTREEEKDSNILLVECERKYLLVHITEIQIPKEKKDYTLKDDMTEDAMVHAISVLSKGLSNYPECTDRIKIFFKTPMDKRRKLLYDWANKLFNDTWNDIAYKEYLFYIRNMDTRYMWAAKIHNKKLGNYTGLRFCKLKDFFKGITPEELLNKEHKNDMKVLSKDEIFRSDKEKNIDIKIKVSQDGNIMIKVGEEWL